MPRTWVVVLHYHGLADTRACLQSLQQQTSSDVHVLVVDNWSADNAWAKLAREFPGVEFVRTDENLGWAGGNNVGVCRALEADAEHIVLLNNDTTADPRLIEALDEAGRRHPTFGILGPIVSDLDPPHAVQTDGFLFNHAAEKWIFSRPGADRVKKARDESRPVPVDIVMGCCLWMRREVIEKIGLIDERFFLVHEESDFCMRAKAAGFDVGIVAEDLLRHRRSASFQEVERNTGTSGQAYYDVRNLKLLMKKHGSGDPTRRGKWRSTLEWLKYAYYCHSDAVERNDPARTLAVTEGAADALWSRWGSYQARQRWTASLIGWFFSGVRWVRGMFGGSRQVAVLPAMETPGTDGEQDEAGGREDGHGGFAGNGHELAGRQGLKTHV